MAIVVERALGPLYLSYIVWVNTMKSKILYGLFPIVSGLSAGLLVAMYFSNSDDRQNQNSNRALAQSVAPAETDKETLKLVKENEVQLSLLRDQISKLKQDNHLNTNSGKDKGDVTNKIQEAIERPSPEEIKAGELAWWDNVNQQFESEEYDSHWAPNATNNFQQDLNGLANEVEFTLVDTDCRSVRCAVTVEFPSYAQATEHFSSFLHHQYKTNCARQTLLPEPDRELGAAPYRATFIFDCSDKV